MSYFHIANATLSSALFRFTTAIAQPNFLATHADLPEENVYLITKTIYENLPFLQAIHPATKAMALERAIALNGLILEHLEDIPESHLSVQVSGHPMEIVELEENRIKLVRVFPKRPKNKH